MSRTRGDMLPINLTLGEGFNITGWNTGRDNCMTLELRMNTFVEQCNIATVLDLQIMVSIRDRHSMSKVS
jgi:hypothetical protein